MSTFFLFSLSSAYCQTDDIVAPFNTIVEYDEFTNTSSIGISGEVHDEEGNALLFLLATAKLDGELAEWFVFAVSGIYESDASDMVYFLTTNGDRFSFFGQAAENTLAFRVNSLESFYNIFSKTGARFRFEEQVYTITDETAEYIHKQITSQINPEEVERFEYRYDSYKSETSWDKSNPNKPRIDFRAVEISYPDSVYRSLVDMERLPYEMFESDIVSFELTINTKGSVVKVNGSTNVDDWKKWKFSESDIQEETRLTLKLVVYRTQMILPKYELKGLEGRLLLANPLPQITETSYSSTIRFEVNPDGSIGRTLPIHRMNPELEREVMRTLRNWRFNPLPSRVTQEAQWGTITFKSGLSFSEPVEVGEEDFFTVVENMPELIGGLAALESSLRQPLNVKCEGRVFLQFIINERGEVENPRVIRGIGGGCDEEALKAIQKAKFKPGLQRGRPVRVQYSLPVVFKLEEKRRGRRGN